MSKQAKITESHKAIAAIVTESTATLLKSEAALARAAQKVETQSVSFVQQLVNAGAKSADFKASTASSAAVYVLYKSSVEKGQSATDQRILAKGKGEPKRKVQQRVGARMGAIGKALARREDLASGKATDKRTKAAKVAKPKTAAGKDSQTGSVSTDTHIESGPVTEVKTSPVPRSIQHPVLIELVNKLAAFDVGQQGVIAESQALQNLLEGLTHTLNVNRIRAREATRKAASKAK
jgi:hypothetical protein